MADTVKVDPTPIQRNKFDVAIELTQLYVETFPAEVANREDIENTFIRFYAIAAIVDSHYPSKLVDFLPEELKKAINR